MLVKMFWGFIMFCWFSVLANEAAGILQKQESLQAFKATLDDLLSDVQDNFRLFIGLESMLKSPPRLQNQQIYQIDEDTQTMLIEK